MSARILLAGVGSVGGLLAGELLSHGHDLTLLTGHAKITAAIQRDGIAIDTLERKFTVAAKAYTTLAELPAGSRFDSAWLLMMAGAVQDAARGPCLHNMARWCHSRTAWSANASPRCAAPNA